MYACMHVNFMLDMEQFTNTFFQLLLLVLLLILASEYRKFPVFLFIVPWFNLYGMSGDCIK